MDLVVQIQAYAGRKKNQTNIIQNTACKSYIILDVGFNH